MSETKQLLKRLTDAAGPSGFEDDVRTIIIEELRNYVDSIEIDGLGNLICTKIGREHSPRIMLSAHMDEVGLMVKCIDDDGFIFFEKHGWIDDRVLLGQWVKIHTKKGPIRGVIGTKGYHMLTPEEKMRVVTARDMWIDVGARSREEASKLGIRIGDPISFDRNLEELANGFVISKSLDDRIGCAVLIQAVKEISRTETNATIYAVGTTQEEIVARGAQVAGYAVNPDIAFVIDTTYGEDPATTRRETSVMMGHGPVIRLMDVFPSAALGTVTSPRVKEFLIKAAEEEGISYQLDIFGNAATDASTLHLVREGIPTGVILIPRRYAHSPAEVAHLSDLENSIKLVVAALKRVDQSFILSFKTKIK